MKLFKALQGEYAINLAKQMAERQITLSVEETFRRLMMFSGFATGSLITAIVCGLLAGSDISGNANTGTFFVITALISTFVFIASILALLVFLWDSFMSQYIQRLSYMSNEIEDEEEEASSEVMAGGLSVFTVPITQPVMPVDWFADGNDKAGCMRSRMMIELQVTSKDHIRDRDMSMHILENQLELLKASVSDDIWKQYQFDRSLMSVHELSAHAAVKRGLSTKGQAAFCTLLPVIASSMTAAAPTASFPLISECLAIVIDSFRNTDDDTDLKHITEARQ